MTVEHSATLIVHPSSAAEGIRSVLASVSIETPDRLRFRYSLEADLSRLRVPPPGPGRRLDELWQHTCFEAFVVQAGEEGYHELNFSPSGDWAAYRFLRYRQGMAPAQLPAAPQINVYQEGTRLLSLDCRVAWPALAAGDPPARLRVALAAVIEADHGPLSYWALRHAPGKPDFHHPDGFALELT